nr:copia protein [Tanacetum cinerariifolium]
MLDRTDFASWQQRIRLYYQGKENEVNIVKSVDEGPFQIGMFRETLAEREEGSLHLGPEQPQVYSDLSPKDKDRYNADIRATSILLQGLPKDIYTLINHYTDAKDIWDKVKMLLEGVKLTKENYESQLYDVFEHFRQHKGETIHAYYVWNQATVQDGKVVVHNVQGRQNRGQGNNARGAGVAGYRGAQNRVGNANSGEARQIKCYNCNDKMLLMQAQKNRVVLDEEQLMFIAGRQDNVVDEDVDEQPVQDLALNVDNVFQVDDCNAFDFDFDDASIAQTMFMANLSSAYPVNDEAGPSYDSDILSGVHDHDHYQDDLYEHHEVHEIHDDVQPHYIVDSHDAYTSDSNMIPYDQYVKNNAVPVVQSNVSSIPNDAYMIILNDMHEQPAQHVSVTTQNNVVDKSLAAEHATYKEQVELDLSAEFEDCSDNSINEVNAVEKSSFIDASQLFDDLDMPELEDITYSDDEDNVGAEADFNNWKHLLQNKKDEKGIVIRNKARLVAQGHTQEEGINYEEVFALVARIKAIRLFLAYASFMGFMVYQMDVKSAFLYGIIEEVVYVYQPSGFEDLDHPDKVYKVVKALYGLHQASRACTLGTSVGGLFGGYTVNALIGLESMVCSLRASAFILMRSLDQNICSGVNCFVALTKEIKEMKEIFEELEAEVDQNVVHRKHDEIEQKKSSHRK